MKNKINIKQYLLKNIDKYLIVELYDNKSQEILDKIAFELKNGFKLVELRQNNCSSADFIKQVFKIRQLCSLYDSMLTINDRIDIAQITESDGIALNCNSINIEYAKKLFHNDPLIGYELNDNSQCPITNLNLLDYIILNSDSKEHLKTILDCSNQIKIFRKEQIKILKEISEENNDNN